MKLHVAHGEGNFTADEATLDQLEAEDRVVFRYCSEDGVVDPASNPNGSARNIAGIVNAERNILRMMPHPERLSDAVIGGTDGIVIFKSLLSHIGNASAVPNN